MSSGQSKRWCFTVNNPSDEDCERVLELAGDAVYLVCGDEVGDSGTRHLQGYVVFSKNYRFKRVAKLLPRAHLVVARGSSEQNRVYCSKGGKFEEFGDCPGDGLITGDYNRNRWSVALEHCKSGDISLIDPEFQIRYYRALSSLTDFYRPRPAINSKLINLWIWGKSGTGKTSWVWEHFPDHYPKLKNKWWDDYKGEPVVAIQEFGKKHEMLSEHVKEWADHYPFRCEKKGSSCVINCRCVVITSNWAPDAIWQEEEVLEPILRRFRVLEFPVNIPSQSEVDEWKSFIYATKELQ